MSYSIFERANVDGVGCFYPSKLDYRKPPPHEGSFAPIDGVSFSAYGEFLEGVCRVFGENHSNAARKVISLKYAVWDMFKGEKLPYFVSGLVFRAFYMTMYNMCYSKHLWDEENVPHYEPKLRMCLEEFFEDATSHESIHVMTCDLFQPIEAYSLMAHVAMLFYSAIRDSCAPVALERVQKLVEYFQANAEREFALVMIHANPKHEDVCYYFLGLLFENVDSIRGMLYDEEENTAFYFSRVVALSLKLKNRTSPISMEQYFLRGSHALWVMSLLAVRTVLYGNHFPLSCKSVDHLDWDAVLKTEKLPEREISAILQRKRCFRLAVSQLFSGLVNDFIDILENDTDPYVPNVACPCDVFMIGRNSFFRRSEEQFLSFLVPDFKGSTGASVTPEDGMKRIAFMRGIIFTVSCVRNGRLASSRENVMEVLKIMTPWKKYTSIFDGLETYQHDHNETLNMDSVCSLVDNFSIDNVHEGRNVPVKAKRRLRTDQSVARRWTLQVVSPWLDYFGRN